MNQENTVKAPKISITMAELLKKSDAEIQLSGEDFPDEVRARILAVLEKAEILEIDLQSLRSMSPSFAYNAFGKLHDVMGDSLLKRLSFINDVRNLKTRIVDAVSRRQKIVSAGT